MSESRPLLPAGPGASRDGLVRFANVKLANKAQTGPDEDAVHGGHVSVRLLLLIGAPLALYALTVFLVGRFYHYWPLSVLLSCGLALSKALLLTQILQSRRWLRWLGRVILATQCAGIVVGLYVYYVHLVYYFHFRDAHKYSNVDPSQPAALFADAGAVRFTTDTRVDVTRAVGYCSAEAGATLCVAPVVDGAMTSSDPISFFAVGVDCCGWRARFSCDDTSHADAGSALLLPDASRLVSSSAVWLTEGRASHERFRAAIRLEEAAFGTAAAEDARLLRWTRDPVRLQDQYWLDALGTSAACGGVLLALCIAVGISAGCGHKRLRKGLRSLLP